MLSVEFAEAVKGTDVYNISEKITYNRNLSTEEKEIAGMCDAWARELAERQDPNRELSAFVKRTVNEEVYNAPDELLDLIFDRGSIGEFDDYEVMVTPRNTLEAHEAAKGGTVDRSWIDLKYTAPTWKNRQVETDLSYVDIRKNGFKSVANLTTYATEALKNAMFYDVFSAVDAAISGGEQLINETNAALTQTSMDALALYINDRDPVNGVAVALSKYAQAMGRMDGHVQYMSEKMKDEFNRYGLINFFSGMKIASISGAKKYVRGGYLIPDKRIFGCAGTIGTLDMRGEVHVYEDFDNRNERVVLSLKDFTYGFCITDLEKVAKIVLK